MKQFTKKNVFYLILLLYTVPFFIQPTYDQENSIKGMHLGLPGTHSGDEPHYYITLYSLVNDHDIYLANNYDHALYQNGSDLGAKRWSEDDRHVRYFDQEQREVKNVIETENIKEIPGHPIGLPLFAFFFLWPFTNTTLLEPLAILLTMCVSLLGIYAFYHILHHYHNDEHVALFFTLILALATPYWHYSKTFWAEPYLASFVIISWYLLVTRHYFFAGIPLAIGFLMKYPFALVIPAYYGYLIVRERRRIPALVLFSLPLACLGTFVLSLNYFFTGNPLGFNQAASVAFANPIIGTLRWLFNPMFGLFVVTPVLVFSLFGVFSFLKKKPTDTCALLGVSIPFFLFFVSYAVTQTGAGGYSARYLVPLIPVFVLLCSFVDRSKKNVSTTFNALLLVSLFINFLAAFAYPAFINEPIFNSLSKIIGFITKIIL